MEGFKADFIFISDCQQIITLVILLDFISPRLDVTSLPAQCNRPTFGLHCVIQQNNVFCVFKEARFPFFQSFPPKNQHFPQKSFQNLQFFSHHVYCLAQSFVSRPGKGSLK